MVFTWADMRRSALAVASALVEADVKPGDAVILISENRVEWLYCDFAIQSVGAMTVPIYPSSPPELVRREAGDQAEHRRTASARGANGRGGRAVGDAGAHTHRRNRIAPREDPAR